jgi:hypothetical protein
MNPATWTRAATFSRTIKMKQSPIAFYLDLPTAESFATQHADAFVVDRHPLSKMIGRAEDRQSLIERQMKPDGHDSPCRRGANQQSDYRMITR